MDKFICLRCKNSGFDCASGIIFCHKHRDTLKTRIIGFCSKFINNRGDING